MRLANTTTAVNLASVYESQGKRVLLIDLDPQASATDYYGLYDRAKSEGRTSIELLYGGAAVSEIAYFQPYSSIQSFEKVNKGT